jgi:hypothetical protein
MSDKLTRKQWQMMEEVLVEAERDGTIIRGSSNATTQTRILKIDSEYVTVEIFQLLEGRPTRMVSVVEIEHLGDPEGAAAAYHDFSSRVYVGAKR